MTTANVTGNFDWGGAVNLDLNVANLSTAQFNAINPGRYAPSGFWGKITGYGPSLHLPSGPGNGLPSQDSPQTLVFTKSDGSVSTSAHIDSAWANNPIGGVIHVGVDVLGANTRNPCP